VNLSTDLYENKAEGPYSKNISVLFCFEENYDWHAERPRKEWTYKFFKGYSNCPFVKKIVKLQIKLARLVVTSNKMVVSIGHQKYLVMKIGMAFHVPTDLNIFFILGHILSGRVTVKDGDCRLYILQL
jgi:hypothetical protein